MQLQYCSITGADDAVDPAPLNILAQEFPFVEWAILWLPEQAGEPRCPSRAWIENFKQTNNNPHTALHLCGQGLIDFIEGKEPIFDLMRGFPRIQLNLEFGNMNGLYAPETLINRIKNNPEWEFIVQYVDEKRYLLPELKDIPNHSLLFDASAGRGMSPEIWPSPIPGHRCGYAGGINPENVGKNLDMISSAAKGQVIWIDMESGVRTANAFDFAKVRNILEISTSYVLKESNSA